MQIIRCTDAAGKETFVFAGHVIKFIPNGHQTNIVCNTNMSEQYTVDMETYELMEMLWPSAIVLPEKNVLKESLSI